MTEIELSPGVYLEAPSGKDNLEAQSTLTEIDSLADNICAEEKQLNSRWVRLGVLVHTVRAKKYWLEAGCQNFGQYVEYVGLRVGKGRSQVYQYVSVAETLLPQISEAVLTEMGITDANELKKMAVATGKPVPQNIIDAALDPDKTIDHLKADIADVTHEAPVDKGKWFDLGGFYLTDDEKALVGSAYKTATQLDPVIRHDIPGHIQTKEVVLRWCQEFLSTYQENV